MTKHKKIREIERLYFYEVKDHECTKGQLKTLEERYQELEQCYLNLMRTKQQNPHPISQKMI